MTRGDVVVSLTGKTLHRYAGRRSMPRYAGSTVSMCNRDGGAASGSDEDLDESASDE
ncbi:MAG TPA: hypothetical protein VKA53_01780 [Thermoanaerobaculia bacterium]|nr:hypothetical protein [Thermoanaerobaculia bacterium]